MNYYVMYNCRNTKHIISGPYSQNDIQYQFNDISSSEFVTDAQVITSEQKPRMEALAVRVNQLMHLQQQQALFKIDSASASFVYNLLSIGLT